jgi:hypothetical protein
LGAEPENPSNARAIMAWVRARLPSQIHPRGRLIPFSSSPQHIAPRAILDLTVPTENLGAQRQSHHKSSLTMVAQMTAI